VLRLLVTANVLSSSIFVTLLMNAIRSSETSDLERAPRRHIPEDGIPHNSYYLRVKMKAMPVTGRRGPDGYETSRPPQFLYCPFVDGVDVRISAECTFP
jgi:hypothetical protein